MTLILLNTPSEGTKKFLKDKLVAILKHKLSNVGKDYRSLSNNVYYINLDDTHLLLMYKTTDNDNVLDSYDIEYDETDTTYYLKFTNDGGSTYVDALTLYSSLSPASLDDIHSQVVDCSPDYVDLDSVQSIPGEKTFSLQKLNTAINDTGTNKFIVMDGNGKLSPATMTLNDFNVAVGTPPDMSAYLAKDDIYKGKQSVIITDTLGGGGTYSQYVTIGHNTSASGYWGGCVAIGRNVKAHHSMAVGIGSTYSSEICEVTGESGVGIGRNFIVSGYGGTGVGPHTRASGSHSVAVGSNSKAEADHCVAIGKSAQATANYAIAMGHNAEASADSDIAIGRTAKAPGLNSIALGWNADCQGDYSIAMGIRAKTESTGNIGIAVGADSFARADNNVSIGYFAGKQITTPNTISLHSYTDTNGNSRGVYIKCADSTESNFRMLVGCQQKYIDTEFGNTTDQLKVFGNVYATGNVNCQALTQRSDERLKTNIISLSHYSLKDILQLRPVEFKWKERKKEGEQYGFIAQEVEEVIPELVDNTNEYKSLKYTSLIPMLVKCIQEQNDMISELKKQNEKLETRLNNIENYLM